MREHALEQVVHDLTLWCADASPQRQNLSRDLHQEQAMILKDLYGMQVDGIL